MLPINLIDSVLLTFYFFLRMELEEKRLIPKNEDYFQFQNGYL